MQEPCVSLKNLLYAQWGTAGLFVPSADNNAAETTNPNYVHFTNRYWAAPPQRIHSFQISVLAGPEPGELIGIGSVLKYAFRPFMPVHIWAIPGTSQTIDQTLPLLRNMIDEVSRIIKANPTGATDLQIVRIAPGYDNQDDIDGSTMVLHRVLNASGLYYKT